MAITGRRDACFWQGKRVLVTGHTGFKGGWLTIWLQRLGASVTGIALPPNTNPNLFHLTRLGDGIDNCFCDIRDSSAIAAIVAQTRPEIAFHLAAQPLVRASYRDPLSTFSSNVMGTANLLDALRGLESVRAAIIVTTDKVYRNNEWAYPYRETDALGGHDPYSASKAACEMVVSSYRDSYLAAQGTAVASARAGNVIGGGDWSEDRLIPDAVRAWQADRELALRSPQTIRPWQHVLDPLAGYLRLAEALWQQPGLAGAYNFGPLPQEAKTVGEIVALARAAHGSGRLTFDYAANQPHEAGTLRLEIAKAHTTLGVSPTWDLAEAVKRTMAWYRAQHQGQDARLLCLADIEAYEAAQ